MSRPATIDGNAPFVLLDFETARGTPARLYRAPVEIVTADTIDAVAPALERLAGAAPRGLHAAGYLAYEAGYAFEARLLALAAERMPAGPLLWFGLFAHVEEIAPDDLASLLPDPAGASAGDVEPADRGAAYRAGVDAVAALIAAGELYQANLSGRSTVRLAGHPLALYAGLRARAGADWGGLVWTGEQWLLSASPELFFTLRDGALTARPMKGTAARASDRGADAAAADALGRDPKNRAENLMIVDLLRNDLSRVAVPGSVVVPRLFDVETYPTLHAMTSTIEARLLPRLGPVDVLAAMFPCGSVTGAPKIRAMEAIAALETTPRGAYTGSMGWIAPDGNAAFNVLIRTLAISAGAIPAGAISAEAIAVGGMRATLGLGAGIVADSRPDDEWDECLLKGAFVARGRRPYDLIETMRFDPVDGLVDLERHLARMGASANVLGFAFERHDLRNALHAATFRLQRSAMLRLRLARRGGTAIEIRDLPDAPAEPVAVAVRPRPVSACDFRLVHKTSDRSLWEAARDAEAFETLFVDADGFLTEGTYSDLFVAGSGMLLTPPLSRAILPGVLRERLIAEGRAREADLRVEDLAGTFWIGNAVRGLIAATLCETRRQ